MRLPRIHPDDRPAYCFAVAVFACGVVIAAGLGLIR